MNYIHNKLYVFDGPSSTFNEYAGNLVQLENALVRVRDMEAHCFISMWGVDKVSVTINKYAHSGGTNTEFQVKGEGNTVAEAFQRAFDNFPKNPLDGASKWVSDRLPRPQDTPIEAEFKETDNEA